ncbi:hypothetical protein BURMUCF2_2720 [Burkholderia multivorans CF2]|nr:hypothetical protein BURMUCF2_2720 [Burkholderia multivorans CF2]
MRKAHGFISQMNLYDYADRDAMADSPRAGGAFHSFSTR